MTQFFFDTADIVSVLSVWNKLSPYISSRAVAGITTNPSAISKAGITSLDQLEVTVRGLCAMVSTIRQDNEGVVYVQMPNDKMPLYKIVDWAQKIATFTDGITRVGLKVPPYPHVLRFLELRELGDTVELNVTGVADAATALRCFTYPEITYVSMIPGRMQEVGIDANAHIQCVQQRHQYKNQRVITGSMRTVQGLREAVLLGTVPTIGQRVWDLIDYSTVGELLNEFSEELFIDTPPLTDERNFNLSKDFFTKMNEFGQPLWDEFRKL
jgi:transaldolase